MQLDIKVPSDLEQQISQALLDSVVGEALGQAIKNICQQIVEDKYDSPVRRAIEEIAKQIIAEMLQTEENKALIQQSILDAFQSDEFKKFVAEAVIRKMRDH